jgi:hypothetical protein
VLTWGVTLVDADGLAKVWREEGQVMTERKKLVPVRTLNIARVLGLVTNTRRLAL